MASPYTNPDKDEPEEVSYEIEILEDGAYAKAEGAVPAMPSIMSDAELSDMLKKVYADMRGKLMGTASPLTEALKKPAPDTMVWPPFEGDGTSMTVAPAYGVPSAPATSKTVTWGGKGVYWDAVDKQLKRMREGHRDG